MGAEQDGPEIPSPTACDVGCFGHGAVIGEGPACGLRPRGFHAAEGGSGGAAGFAAQIEGEWVGILVWRLSADARRWVMRFLQGAEIHVCGARRRRLRHPLRSIISGPRNALTYCFAFEKKVSALTILDKEGLWQALNNDADIEVRPGWTSKTLHSQNCKIKGARSAHMRIGMPLRTTRFSYSATPAF
jgi:hypothetical protein